MRRRLRLFSIVGIASLILAAATTGANAASIAVFDNPVYVDTDSGFIDAESDNIQASLTQLGHSVSTFTGITASDFAAAFSASDMILFPELEKGDLNAALSAATVACFWRLSVPDQLFILATTGGTPGPLVLLTVVGSMYWIGRSALGRSTRLRRSCCGYSRCCACCSKAGGVDYVTETGPADQS